ncbi:MAG: DNA mismatch endonuclease Vsr [Thermodesulfobacteriota bacterium]
MTDVLTPQQRRLNMSRIKGRDTKPEMFLRRGLHGRGLRFRLYRCDLPGCPDLTFPSHHAVIFVHGCFWHGHGCILCKIPETHSDFWIAKIARNVERDRQAVRKLLKGGWRVLIVWECAMRGRGRLSEAYLLKCCETFIRSHGMQCEEISAKESMSAMSSVFCK